MKKLFLCAAAVLAAVAVGGCWGRNPISAAAENKSIDVYLIGGQSNAVGTATTISRQTATPTPVIRTALKTCSFTEITKRKKPVPPISCP